MGFSRNASFSLRCQPFRLRVIYRSSSTLDRALTYHRPHIYQCEDLSRFPGVESLAIHHSGPFHRQGDNDLTIKDLFAQCSFERAPPLKKLDLLNVPLQIDTTTTPFLVALETLSTTFTAELFNAMACDGPLPVIDESELRSLNVMCSFDDTAFMVIPGGGLRHLSFLDMKATDLDQEAQFGCGILKAILPGHQITLESLLLSPYRYKKSTYRHWAAMLRWPLSSWNSPSFAIYSVSNLHRTSS